MFKTTPLSQCFRFMVHYNYPICYTSIVNMLQPCDMWMLGCACSCSVLTLLCFLLTLFVSRTVSCDPACCLFGNCIRDLCDSAWGDTVRWRDAQLQEVTNLFLVFQTIEMRPPHYVGAGMAFGLGLVYCWLQTSISLRHPPIDYVTVAQLINSVVLSVCLVTCILSWV